MNQQIHANLSVPAIGIDAGTFAIKVVLLQDGNLIVAPASPQTVSAEVLKEKLDYIIKKREKALRRLAQ